VKQLITAEEGSYRGVAQRLRLGISYASLHRIAAGVTKSSWVIPDLLRYLNLVPSEHIDLELGEELTDEQIAWLKLLADLKGRWQGPRGHRDPHSENRRHARLEELPVTPRDDPGISTMLGIGHPPSLQTV